MLIEIAIHSLSEAKMVKRFLGEWNFFSFPISQKSLLSGGINVFVLLHLSAVIIHFKVDVSILLAGSVVDSFSSHVSISYTHNHMLKS